MRHSGQVCVIVPSAWVESPNEFHDEQADGGITKEGRGLQYPLGGLGGLRTESLGVALMAEIHIRLPMRIAAFCELALAGHIEQAKRIAIAMSLVAGHTGRGIIRGWP